MESHFNSGLYEQFKHVQFGSAARQGVPPVFCCSDFSFYSEAALRILPQTVSSVRTVQVGPAPSDDVVFANLQC